MSREPIPEDVKRRLYAESMGRCMNPSCHKQLFSKNGDIIEKAHIDPYCETADNSFENLIVLCPSCHTDFDKNHAFTSAEVLEWKKIRQEEVEKLFSLRFSSFDELKDAVAPLLEENKSIYENYYLKNKELWKKFEVCVLQNNRKLKLLLARNIDLIQYSRNPEYSNQTAINAFLLHVEEFEGTRCGIDETRSVLFPPEIDSMFGVAPIEDSLIPSTESLELFIDTMMSKGCFSDISMGTDHPYISYWENDELRTVLLNDTPRLRQMYYDNQCFRSVGVRLDSLNFALKYIRSRYFDFEFVDLPCLREVRIANNNIKLRI